MPRPCLDMGDCRWRETRGLSSPKGGGLTGPAEDGGGNLLISAEKSGDNDESRALFIFGSGGSDCEASCLI